MSEEFSNKQYAAAALGILGVGLVAIAILICLACWKGWIGFAIWCGIMGVWFALEARKYLRKSVESK